VGLDQDVYLSIVKFLNSFIVRKIWLNIFILFIFLYFCCDSTLVLVKNHMNKWNTFTSWFIDWKVLLFIVVILSRLCCTLLYCCDRHTWHVTRKTRSALSNKCWNIITCFCEYWSISIYFCYLLYIYLQFSTRYKITVTLVSTSHLSSPPLIPNVKCIAWNFDGSNIVSDEDKNESLMGRIYVHI
jgi:hypothetical protein